MATHDEREEQRSFDLLRGALNETNRAKFDAMPIEEKRWIVDEAFKDGILRYNPVRLGVAMPANLSMPRKTVRCDHCDEYSGPPDSLCKRCGAILPAS